MLVWWQEEHPAWKKEAQLLLRDSTSCQLKSGKMLHKCSTDCTWKGLQLANALHWHLRSLTLMTCPPLAHYIPVALLFPPLQTNVTALTQVFTRSCRWGTAQACYQLKSGKMLHKCSTDGTWKGLQPGNDLHGDLRSLTLVPFDRTHHFLLVFHWKYVSILYRFRDINTCLPKI